MKPKTLKEKWEVDLLIALNGINDGLYSVEEAESVAVPSIRKALTQANKDKDEIFKRILKIVDKYKGKYPDKEWRLGFADLEEELKKDLGG